MSSTPYETLKFSRAIRGYVYRYVWQPKDNETLPCDHESDNDYNLFSIKPAEMQSSVHRSLAIYH